MLAFDGASRVPASGEPAGEESCVAEAIVDAIGVERLRDVATPREIATAASGEGVSLAGLGLEVDAGQADAIYSGIEGCGDPAEMLVASIPGPQLSGPVADCFTAGLDDALVREVVMTQLVDGDEALAEHSEITSQLTALGRACAAGGT